MKLKPVLMYLFFFMAVFIIFLFILFPQQKAAAYLSRTLSASHPNFTINIDKVSPALPFNLNFENTLFFLDKAIQIHPESFAVSLGHFSIFSLKKRIKFQSRIHQGHVNGSLYLDQLDPFICSDIKGTASNVKISNFTYASDIADIVLGCKLSGEFMQTVSNDKKTSGQGFISIKEFSAKINNSLFNTLNLPVVDFSDIKLEFAQKPGGIEILQCNAKGSVINVKLKGTIDIVFPLQDSRLTLSGVVLPDSPYLAKFANLAAVKSVVKNISKTGIKIRITGTLGNPKILL